MVGGGAIPWFLVIFEVTCTPNFVCKLEWPFSNILCKKSHENCMFFFLRFFYVKINFCLYFTHKIIISQFSWAHSHYDVIVTSNINGWYLFWYQWKEDIHTYTMVVNLGLYDLQYGYSRGGLQQPPSENRFGKTRRITRVKVLRGYRGVRLFSCIALAIRHEYLHWKKSKCKILLLAW